MNDSTAIIGAKDFPTHKLTVRLEDGTFRIFRLNGRQAQFIVEHINSVEQFIVLPRDIDPDAPTAYPKRGAWVEKMSAEELEAGRRRYADSTRAFMNAEQEAAVSAARAERTKAIRAWIGKHPEHFERMKMRAAAALVVAGGMYHHASKSVKASLAHYEAMRAVDDILAKQEDKGRKETSIDPNGN